jgi:hypothetical protein
MGHYRLIALLVGLAAALAVPAAGSSAPADQVRGPGCGDITLWDPDQAGPPVYSTFGGTPPTVSGLLTTAKPSCGGATYTFSVYDESGTTLLGSQTFTGDDATSSFSLSVVPTGGPSRVCIAGASARDGHVIDVAPNTGCYVLALDTSPGGSGLN